MITREMVHYFVVYLTMQSVIRLTQRRRRGHGNQEHIRKPVTQEDTDRPYKKCIPFKYIYRLGFSNR